MLYMVGKHSMWGFLWYLAKCIWNIHLGYRILLSLWDWNHHYSWHLVLKKFGVKSYWVSKNGNTFYKHHIYISTLGILISDPSYIHSSCPAWRPSLVQLLSMASQEGRAATPPRSHGHLAGSLYPPWPESVVMLLPPTLTSINFLLKMTQHHSISKKRDIIPQKWAVSKIVRRTGSKNRAKL